MKVASRVMILLLLIHVVAEGPRLGKIRGALALMDLAHVIMMMLLLLLLLLDKQLLLLLLMLIRWDAKLIFLAKPNNVTVEPVRDGHNRMMLLPDVGGRRDLLDQG
jgi:hypothetical protein